MVGVHTANSTGVGFKQVSSVVQALRAEVCLPCFSLGVPCDAHRFFAVERIRALIDGSQIAYSIIVNNLIDVVDYCWRLLSVVDHPRNTVSHVPFALMGEGDVTEIVSAVTEVASFTDPAVCVDFVPDFPSFGVVGIEVCDVRRDNSTSHFESPLNLVRGSVAPTTDAPILS